MQTLRNGKVSNLFVLYVFLLLSSSYFYLESQELFEQLPLVMSIQSGTLFLGRQRPCGLSSFEYHLKNCLRKIWNFTSGIKKVQNCMLIVETLRKAQKIGHYKFMEH